MEEIILVGYGGHAKSVADCIERKGLYHIFGYTDLKKHDSPYNFLGSDDILEAYYNQGIHSAVVCVGYLGNGILREQLYSKLKDIGFRLPVISDPGSIVSDSAKIGEGTFVGKGAVVNSDAIVGKMAIINTNAVVEHDCIVDDFSHIAVGAVLCGGVKVGKNCLVGANATILQTLRIGDRTIIAAGTTVVNEIGKDVVVKNRLNTHCSGRSGGAI